jgi:TIR domain
VQRSRGQSAKQGAVQTAVAEPGPVNVGATLPQSIYASYASRDRETVLDRLDVIRFFGIDVLVDCLDLVPNEPWKTALKREIAARKLFLLFCSEAAKKSAWVRRECRQAIVGLQVEPICVRPLETGVDPRQAAVARIRRLGPATKGAA